MGTRPASPLMADCGAPDVIALSESLSSKSFATRPLTQGYNDWCTAFRH